MPRTTPRGGGMASSVETIQLKVIGLLYSRTTATNFRAFQNSLVDEGILNDEELEQHHRLIDRLFYEWLRCFQARDSEQRQRLPVGPSTPESLPPQATPPKTFTSSPPEDARTATAVEVLKHAVTSINANVSYNSPPLPTINDLLQLTPTAV